MNLFKQFLRGYALGIALTVAVFLIASYAHCAVSKKHDNSLGAVMYMDNPMSYIAGDVSAVAYVDGGKGIVVRVQPLGTYSLYTDEKLFCGPGAVDKFKNVANPMVLTYRTKASRLLEGLGCHDLVSVDGLKPKDMLQ